MKVLNSDEIDEYIDAHPKAKDALLSLHQRIQDTTWKKPTDLNNLFSNCEILDGECLKFKLKGGQYRLVVRVKYAQDNFPGVVIYKWFGKHTDYDKIKDIIKLCTGE